MYVKGLGFRVEGWVEGLGLRVYVSGLGKNQTTILGHLRHDNTEAVR